MNRPKQQYEALATAIKERIAELGWSQADLHRQMTLRLDSKPPAFRTMTHTIAATHAPSPSTRRAFEVALGWPVGTCDKILDGADAPSGEPPPAEQEQATPMNLEQIHERLAALESSVDFLLKREIMRN